MHMQYPTETDVRLLRLYEQEVRATGRLDAPEWLERAEKVYTAQQDKTLQQALDYLDQALTDIAAGCEQLQSLLNQPVPVSNWQAAHARIIKGSYYLMGLTRTYYKDPPRFCQWSRLFRLFWTQSASLRVEERLKTVQYIHDFLQLSGLATPHLSPLHRPRLDRYLMELPNESQHLAQSLRQNLTKKHQQHRLQLQIY